MGKVKTIYGTVAFNNQINMNEKSLRFSQDSYAYSIGDSRNAGKVQKSNTAAAHLQNTLE